MSIQDTELDQIIEHMSKPAKPVVTPKFIHEIQQKLLYVSILFLLDTINSLADSIPFVFIRRSYRLN